MENKLNELNIFALRDLARRTGVSSPTSKKKEELIKGILEIMSGAKEPEKAKTRQGRPPKVFGYDFANVFSVENKNLSTLTLNQQVPAYENDDMVTVAGWLEMFSNGSAILWTQKNLKNDNYFVPSNIVDLYNVKVGDRLVVSVSIDENNKLVNGIFNINGCPIKKFDNTRKNYSEIEHILPNRSLKFASDEYADLNLKIGENVYIYGANNNANTIKIIDILNSCETANKLYVNVSVADKNKIYLSQLKNVEMFITNITDEVDISRRVVSLAIERAKRLCENGEDVVIVVDDILSVVGLDKEGLNLAKNLVSLAKEGNDKGSITLIGVMPEKISQIEKLADKRLTIENNNIILN